MVADISKPNLENRLDSDDLSNSDIGNISGHMIENQAFENSMIENRMVKNNMHDNNKVPISEEKNNNIKNDDSHWYNSPWVFIPAGLIVASSFLSPDILGQQKNLTECCDKNPVKIMPDWINSVLTSEHTLQSAAIMMYTTKPKMTGDEIVLDLTGHKVTFPKDSIKNSPYNLKFVPMTVSEYFKEYHARIDCTSTYNAETKKMKHKNLRELETLLEPYVSDEKMFRSFIKDGKITRNEFDALDYGLNAFKIIAVDKKGKYRASIIALDYRGPGYEYQEPKVIPGKTDTVFVPSANENPEINQTEEIPEPLKHKLYIALGATSNNDQITFGHVKPKVSLGYENQFIAIGADYSILLPEIRNKSSKVWSAYKGGYSELFMEAINNLKSAGLHFLVGGENFKIGGNAEYNWGSIQKNYPMVYQLAVDTNDQHNGALGTPPAGIIENIRYISGGPEVMFGSEYFGVKAAVGFSKRTSPEFSAQLLIKLGLHKDEK